MIELEDIAYEVDHGPDRIAILKGVTLAMASGTTASLMGPSGSGKSSLLALIAGMERPTRGRIRVHGQDLSGLDADGLALFRRDHLGIVFQDFHLIPAMTALENVALPLELSGRADARPRAEAMLVEVGLSHRLDHRPPTLSGGEQQRVAIARAFVARPPLILADELTGNLDPVTGGRIVNLLFDLIAQSGAALFLVTHDAQLAERAARRFLLTEGRLRESG